MNLHRYLGVLLAILATVLMVGCVSHTPKEVWQAHLGAKQRALASFALNVDLLQTAPPSERRTTLIETTQESLKLYAIECESVEAWLKTDPNLPSGERQDAALKAILETLQSLLRRGET